MPTSIGPGIVWGTSATGFSVAGFAVDWSSTGESYSREADTTEIKGSDGNTATVVFTNYRQGLKLKCFPSGANATANSMPYISNVVTVVGTDSDIAGDWLVMGVSKERKNDGVVEFDLDLKRFSGLSLTPPV